MNKLPAKYEPSWVTAIVDTREQHPLDLNPINVELGTLATGDYAIKGLEHVARIERKSLPDLLQCCGHERERFEREIERLLAFSVRVLLVEATWADIELGQWRSKLTPKQVEGSLLGWMAKGIQVELVGDHERAGRFAAKLLYTIARRHWESLRLMYSHVVM
jgi:ERCC4-type nuclease